MKHGLFFNIDGTQVSVVHLDHEVSLWLKLIKEMLNCIKRKTTSAKGKQQATPFS